MATKTAPYVHSLRAEDAQAETLLTQYQRHHLAELRRRFLTQSVVARKANDLFDWLQLYAPQFTKLMYRDATDSYAFWAQKADCFVFVNPGGVFSYGPEGTFSELAQHMEAVEGLLPFLFEKQPAPAKPKKPRIPRLNRAEMVALKEVQRRMLIPFSDESSSWVSQLGPLVWEIRELNNVFYFLLGTHKGKERVCIFRKDRISYELDHAHVPLQALYPDTRDLSKLIPHLFGRFAAPLSVPEDLEAAPSAQVQGKASETLSSPISETPSPSPSMNLSVEDATRHAARLEELFQEQASLGGGWDRSREAHIQRILFRREAGAYLVVLQPPHSGQALATFRDGCLGYCGFQESILEKLDDLEDLTPDMDYLLGRAPIKARKPSAGSLVNPPEPLPEAGELGPNPCAEHAVGPMEFCKLGAPAWMGPPIALNKDQNWYLLHAEKALAAMESNQTLNRYQWEPAMLGVTTHLFQTSFSNTIEGPNGWFVVVGEPYSLVVNFSEDFVNRLPLYGFLEQAARSGKHHDMSYLLPHLRANRLSRLRELEEGTKTYPERQPLPTPRESFGTGWLPGTLHRTPAPLQPEDLAFGQPWKEDPDTFDAARHPYAKLMHEKAMRHPWLQTGSRSERETQILAHRDELVAKVLSEQDAAKVAELQLLLEEFRTRINRELGESGGADGASILISEIRESEGKVMMKVHRSTGQFASFVRCSRYEKASFPSRLYHVWDEATDLSHLKQHLYGVRPMPEDLNAETSSAIGQGIGSDDPFDFSGVQPQSGGSAPNEIGVEELGKLQSAISEFLNPVGMPPLGAICPIEIYEENGSFHLYLAMPDDTGTGYRDERTYLVLHPGIGSTYLPVSKFPRLRAVGRDFSKAISLLRGVEDARGAKPASAAPADPSPLGEDLTPQAGLRPVPRIDQHHLQALRERLAVWQAQREPRDAQDGPVEVEFLLHYQGAYHLLGYFYQESHLVLGPPATAGNGELLDIVHYAPAGTPAPAEAETLTYLIPHLAEFIRPVDNSGNARRSGNGFDVQTAPADVEPSLVGTTPPWGEYGFTSFHQSHFPELRRRLDRFKASSSLLTVAYRILQIHGLRGDYHVMIEFGPDNERRNVVLQEHGQHLAAFEHHGVLGNALDLSNLLPYLGADVPAKPLPVLSKDQAEMERDQERERLVEQIEQGMPQIRALLEEQKDWLRKNPQLFAGNGEQAGLQKQREKDALDALIKFYCHVQYGA